MVTVTVNRRKPFKLPKVLTPNEQHALLRQPKKRWPTGARNLLAMRLMLNIGLRCSELLNIRMTDLDLNTGRLHVVNGKNHKDRALWVNQYDLELARLWIERRPVQSEWLFTTLKGKQVCGRYMREAVARYGRKAGITRRVHPHLLRHCAGTDLYRETKDLRLVQRVLGHANVSTTQIYTFISDPEVEQALKTFRQPANERTA